MRNFNEIYLKQEYRTENILQNSQYNHYNAQASQRMVKKLLVNRFKLSEPPGKERAPDVGSTYSDRLSGQRYG